MMLLAYPALAYLAKLNLSSYDRRGLEKFMPARWIVRQSWEGGHGQRMWDGTYIPKLALPKGVVSFLGSGAFCCAFLLVNGHVLKVGSAEDYGLDYAELCQANPDHPYLPRVYEVFRGDGWWACEMEQVTTESARAIGAESARDFVDTMRDSVSALGVDCNDIHGGNYGITEDGRAVVLDPSTRPGRHFRPDPIPPRPQPAYRALARSRY